MVFLKVHKLLIVLKESLLTTHSVPEHSSYLSSSFQFHATLSKRSGHDQNS